MERIIYDPHAEGIGNPAISLRPGSARKTGSFASPPRGGFALTSRAVKPEHCMVRKSRRSPTSEACDRSNETQVGSRVIRCNPTMDAAPRHNVGTDLSNAALVVGAQGGCDHLRMTAAGRRIAPSRGGGVGVGTCADSHRGDFGVAGRRQGPGLASDSLGTGRSTRRAALRLTCRGSHVCIRRRSISI